MGDHTAGPWTISQTNVDEFEVSAPDSDDPDNDWNVALVYGGCGYPLDQSPANARLIAAAPDLLAALEAAVDAYESDSGRWVQAAYDAIAKAKGD